MVFSVKKNIGKEKKEREKMKDVLNGLSADKRETSAGPLGIVVRRRSIYLKVDSIGQIAPDLKIKWWTAQTQFVRVFQESRRLSSERVLAERVTGATLQPPVPSGCGHGRPFAKEKQK